MTEGRRGRWRVTRLQSTAGEIHSTDPVESDAPGIWVMHPTDRSLVLGSGQALEDVDTSATDRLGLAVVKRRTGGGAVVVEPGAQVWVDVLISRDDPHWTDDVGQSSIWLGRLWQSVLADLGFDTVLHEPPMRSSQLSNMVCFAGRGPGELTLAGQKVLGVSQRRSRDLARFQCSLITSWDPDLLVPALRGLHEADLDQLRDLAIALPVEGALVEEAFLEAMALV